MDIEKATGYEDQEMLLTAFINYISKKINRPVKIIRGMMRQSIHDGVIRHNTTLKYIRYLDEDKRLQIFTEMVDIFLNKVSHIIGNKFQRDRIRKDAVQIYNHWKKTKRVDPSQSLLSEMEKIMELDED
jgi:hypothetical protein